MYDVEIVSEANPLVTNIYTIRINTRSHHLHHITTTDQKGRHKDESSDVEEVMEHKPKNHNVES